MAKLPKETNTPLKVVEPSKPVQKLYVINEEAVNNLFNAFKKLAWETADPFIKYLQANLKEVPEEQSKKEGE